MPADKPNRKAAARKRRLAEAIEALTALQFGPKQRNETAAYTLLALLDLQHDVPWTESQAPLCGITPVIDFIATAYGVRYAPNTRETIEQFCPAFAPGSVVIYIGDTENKFVHMEVADLAALGVTLDSAAKIPDVIVHYTAKNWLLLIEAVTSAGPVDGKRRKELKDLFTGCKAGLVFVTAFENRRTMQSFVSHIAWESEVWIAEDPDHMIHFNGERFLGPYPDVTPSL